MQFVEPQTTTTTITSHGRAGSHASTVVSGTAEIVTAPHRCVDEWGEAVETPNTAATAARLAYAPRPPERTEVSTLSRSLSAPSADRGDGQNPASWYLKPEIDQ